MPKDFRAFDYSTISDLVIHLRYTARDGGEPLATLATDSLADRLNALVRSQSDDGLVALMSVRHDFATQWQSAKQQPEKPVSLQLFDELFPYMFRSRVRVRISGAVFAWLVLDDQGQWITSKRDGVVTIEPNKLPAVVIPKEVAMAVDDPWLVVIYGVDAVPTQGQVQ